MSYRPLPGEGPAQDSRLSRLPLPRAPARVRALLCPPVPDGGPRPSDGRQRHRSGSSAAGQVSPGVPPRTWEEETKHPPPVPRNPQAEQANRERCCCTALPRATRRPPGPGSSRSCRAARAARTPDPPWCSRCCSTGTPGRSPGCWAAKILRGKGREKKNTVPETPPGPDQRRPHKDLPPPGRGARSCSPVRAEDLALPPPAKVNAAGVTTGGKQLQVSGLLSLHPQESYRPTDTRPCLGQPKAEAQYYKI